MPTSEPHERDLRDAVRAELTHLRREFENPGPDTKNSMTQGEVVARALARIRQRDAGKVGRLGERVARVPGGKRRVPSLTGSARYRVPDILTDTEVIEVKNVARLTLTPQLRDFALFAATSGRRFVLETRFDTVLAPDLQALVDEGQVEHRHLAGLLSPAGRRLIRRMIHETLQDE